jgi:hypothetical protein
MNETLFGASNAVGGAPCALPLPQQPIRPAGTGSARKRFLARVEFFNASYDDEFWKKI